MVTASPRAGASGRGRVLGELWLIISIAAPYLLLALWQRLRLPCRRFRQRLDQWSAHTFIRFARTHGALLIKVGQFIATRPDLFTQAWISACSDLRDQAPAKSFAYVQATLRDAYPDATSPFVSMELEPLAAASFGQVHRAVLPDGRTVAVKVQHYGIARLIGIDLTFVRIAMRLLRLVMPGFPFKDLMSELGTTSRAELDYLQEASSMDRLRPVLKRYGIDTPQVYWEYTRQSVLVMEYASGTTLARLDYALLTPVERRVIATRVLDAYLGMLLDEGFYHADPHAGNLIYDQGRLWLIDFGMTSTLTSRQAELYRRFLSYVQQRDIDGMLEIMLRLGFVMPNIDHAQLKSLAQRLYESVVEVAPGALKGSQRRMEIGWAINEILMHSPGVVFPQHTIMLTRATSMLEGLCAELVPEASLLSLARPLLRRRMTPWLKLRYLMQEGREMWAMLGSLPSHIAKLKHTADHHAAQAMLAGCCLIAALLLPEGHWRVIAAVTACLAIVWVLRRPVD